MSGTRDRIVQSAEKNLSRGRLDQALKDYLRVLDDNPKDVFALNKAGDLCVRMGRPADAIGHFARIADSYSADGFFLKAIAIYKKINKIDPTRLDVYERLAGLYTKQGLTQDARSHYSTLAEQWLKKNDLKSAIGAFSSASRCCRTVASAPVIPHCCMRSQACSNAARASAWRWPASK